MESSSLELIIFNPKILEIGNARDRLIEADFSRNEQNYLKVLCVIVGSSALGQAVVRSEYQHRIPTNKVLSELIMLGQQSNS